MTTNKLFPVLAVMASLGLGCGSGDTEGGTDEESCAGGKCDEADSKAEVTCLTDSSGNGLKTFALGDALAKIALADDVCPLGYVDTVEKLKASGKCETHDTMGVTETRQLAGQGGFRTVTRMDCSLGKDADGNEVISGVWFSAFGVSAEAGKGDLGAAEVIAFDPTEGVFNYYDTGREFQFFGDSMQFLQDTREPEEAAGSATARCAGCHRGGGLIMKELTSPWMHWTPDFDSPGHSDLISRNADTMGDEASGITLEEDIVVPVNRIWNQRRVAMVKSGLGTGPQLTLKLLLRPLFCSEDLQLDSNFGDSVSSGPIGQSVVVDETISGFGSVTVTQDDYNAVTSHFNQRMGFGTFKDTIGSLTRIHRGASDVNYQQQLVEQNVVDQEFIEDVLMVDMTRAVLSDDRCDLLMELDLPKMTEDDVNPEAVKNAFLEALGDSQVEQDFRKYLENDDDDARGTATRFEQTCTSRQDKALLTNDGRVLFEGDADFATAEGQTVLGVTADYLSYIFHTRAEADDLAVFEFTGATMPITDKFPAGTRLDPNTCRLTTEYVSVDPILKGQDPDPDGDGGRGGDGNPMSESCTDRCGNFSDEATCQCDNDCLPNDDCCDDFKSLCEDTTAAATCEGRCGDMQSELGCQCDFECDERGDCCNDWTKICMDPSNPDFDDMPPPEKLSCDGRCNTFDPSKLCQCNSFCEQFGDCCPDFGQVCG